MSDSAFKYNGLDLRTCTVFDLTNDKDFLNRFLAPELGIKTKEDFLLIGAQNSESRCFLMLEYAEYKNDNVLTKQLKYIYNKELSQFFNE